MKDKSNKLKDLNTSLGVKNSNKNDRKNNDKAFDYLFPYLLEARTETSRPNVVWQMDFTHLDSSLKSAPESGHYLLLIVDMFNNHIICSKVFLLSNGRGTITSHKLLKCLKQAVEERKLTESLILNADRGSEFVSKDYYTFVNSHPFLIGSHSAAATPNHNAVVERMHRTFKNQTQQYPVPKIVTHTRDLQRFVDKKTYFLNNEFIHKRNIGNTAIELSTKQETSAIVEPEVILHRRERVQPFSPNYEMMLVYRKALSELTISKHAAETIAELLVYSIERNENTHQEMLNEVVNLAGSIEEIRQNTATKPKISHQAQIARDPLSATVYEAILNEQRPAGANRLNWSRFKVASTVLFYTGLRINEICYMTPKMMDDLCTKQKCSFYQSKVKKERAVLLPPHAIESFKKIKEDIAIVYKNYDVLYPISPQWRHKFPEMINKYLQPYAKKFNLRLTSHSFRINFVTDLLRHEVPTHVTQELIGHTDIRSTMSYKRYTTTDEDKIRNLSKPFLARQAAKKAEEEPENV